MSDGKAFEFEVQELLRLMGLDATVTGYSQDGGIDLTAVNPDPVFGGKYVIQCKAQKKSVGEPVVRDLFGTMHAAGANKGILITTSDFTSAAQRFASGKPLELINGKKYQSLCEQYGLTPFGETEELPHSEEGSLLEATNVRIKSFDCSDPEEQKEIQMLVFCEGSLSIGNSLTFKSSDGAHFACHAYKITKTEREMKFGFGLDELKICFNDTTGASFVLEIEGQTKIVEALSSAASSMMSSGNKPSAFASKGCLALLFLPIALASVCCVVMLFNK